MTTVYASIGNSDDKLSQRDWATFCRRFRADIRQFAHPIHGEWFSAPDAPWQNANVCFEIEGAASESLKGVLAELAADFGQDSIAWAEVHTTEFIGPPKVSAEPLIDPDCRAGKHAPTCVGDPCDCECHQAEAERQAEMEGE